MELPKLPHLAFERQRSHFHINTVLTSRTQYCYETIVWLIKNGERTHKVVSSPFLDGANTDNFNLYWQGDLTITLVQQCHQSQNTVQRIIESAGDDEALLFEALSINDEIQNVISKFEDIKVHNTIVPIVPERAMIPIAAEPDELPQEGKDDALIRKSSSSTGGSQRKNNDDVMDDLDEMIFGKNANGMSGTGHIASMDSSKDDLISL